MGRLSKRSQQAPNAINARWKRRNDAAAAQPESRGVTQGDAARASLDALLDAVAHAARDAPDTRDDGGGSAALRAVAAPSLHDASPPALPPAHLSAAAEARAVAVPCAPFKRELNTCFAVAALTLLASLEGFAATLCDGADADCCAVMQQLRCAFREAVPALGGGTPPSVSLIGFLDAARASRCVAPRQRCAAQQSLAPLLQEAPTQQRQQDAQEFLERLLPHAPEKAAATLRFTSETLLTCSACPRRKKTAAGLDGAFVAPLALPSSVARGTELTLEACIAARPAAAPAKRKDNEENVADENAKQPEAVAAKPPQAKRARGAAAAEAATK